ncbi:delta9-fatty acid desaturase [Amylostereum chailletii]|nr:delta9-fatty acid desaturase [Amylostereum chailletii]
MPTQDSSTTDLSVDVDIPDNYIHHTLQTTEHLRPITWSNFWRELNYVNLAVTGIPHLLVLYGVPTTNLERTTAMFAALYYFITGLGITAGYHRYWAHRSYNASQPLQYFLAIAGSGAGQGTIKWWARGHRAHHRYTDTPLDPYDITKGLMWAHIGWIVFKPRRRQGVSDISDLRASHVVRWQAKHYLWLLLFMALGLPTLIPGLCWGDWRGGFVYAGAVRLCCVYHSTWCVNSLAHYLGDAPFDDKHTPRDHVITALATNGEGYHNFHHQFPTDYRSAIEWYQYDPTKWFIWACSKAGLASHLKVFPQNEVAKGQLTMKLKQLYKEQGALRWPPDIANLPVVSWSSFQDQAKKHQVILISGFIYDVSAFIEEHPGGSHILLNHIGKDASFAFFGGVYEHSNAAHNLLSMMRVGILHGGHPHALEEKVMPSSQRLRIARYNELPAHWSATDGDTMID